MLAAAFLGGEWDADAMTARARRAIGRRAWLRAVAVEVLAAYHRPPLDRPRELGAYVAIVLDERRRRGARAARAARAAVSPGDGPRAVAGAADRHRRRPGGVPRTRLRRSSPGSPTSAGWSVTVDDERLRHYRYSRLPRDHGPPRVLERPKARLKAIQRRILREILAWIPVHDGRARVRPRPLGPDPCRAPHRPARGRAAGPRGLLRRRRRRARVRHLPHGRLSGGRRAHADRAVHERGAGRASRSPATTGSPAAWPRRTCRRARPRHRRSRTSPRSGSTAA